MELVATPKNPAGVAAEVSRLLSRRAVVSALALTAASPLIGCGPERRYASTGRCPAEFDAIVVWTTQEHAETEVQLYGRDGLSGRVRIKVQGAKERLGLRGDRLTFVTNGDVKYDKQHIVTADLTSCEGTKFTGTAFRFDQPSIWGTLIHDGRIFTTNYLNGVGQLLVHDLATGDQVADVQTPLRLIRSLAADRSRVYGFTDDYPDEGANRLLVIDPAGWKIQRELDITAAGAAVTDCLVVGEELYFAGYNTAPQTEQPNDRIGVINLRTLKLSVIKLDQALPYQFATDGKTVYVAHTFLNEAFQPYSAARYVTRIDRKTKTTKVIDTAPNLTQISVSGNGQRLYGLHGHGEVDPRLTTTDLTDPTPPRQLAIAPPEERGYHYLASMIAR